MNTAYLLYTGALHTFHDFSGADSALFTYTHDAPAFSELRRRYPIDEAAGNGEEFVRLTRLMAWCSRGVLHNGGTKDVEFVPKTSLGVLDYAFGKGREYGVYCRLQAIVFTECCLALGIRSRILHCLPFSPYDFDTHVVSMVFLKSLNKWVLFDAGNNRCFFDENDVPLSPLEARTRLGAHQYIRCNVDDEQYKTYMAKNLFYFKSPRVNTFGADLAPEQATIYCAPQGFDVLQREVDYCAYGAANSPEPFAADWRREMAVYQARKRICNVSADVFFGV